MSKPKQSEMMSKLYGEKIAKIVYARCQELGEDFNHRVQAYVYDTIWAKPGIALREKSLITVVALILTNKAEQLKIHLWGLFYQGYLPEDIINILNYLVEKNYIKKIDQIEKILTNSKEEYLDVNESKFSIKPPLDLKGKNREENILNFAAHIAMGDNEKTGHCVKALLESGDLSAEDMKHIMQHVAVYCGFPVEMNGLMVLNSVTL